MKALREIPKTAGYKKGDVLVLFGELFSKGYANGIVDEAEKLGMTIIRSTVGRRDADGHLRALNEEEASSQPLPFINIPLEAGFDMEPAKDGTTPCDQLKGIKMSDWDANHLDWEKIKQSQVNGVHRFRKNVTAYMAELQKYIPEGANVLFVHTMAGGVPRAKILMPVMNKVFKGRGDRHVGSKALFDSDIGKFSQMNFSEVTAHTFHHLVDLSTMIRKNIESKGQKVSYVAYGYHGTEVLIDGKYQWQTYTPYFQGWAKMELEDHCKTWMDKGVHCTVFNCPEILTNSSSIFQGVEVSLYPLLGALQKEGEDSAYCKKVLDECRSLLKEEHNFAEIMNFTSAYVKNPLIQSHSHFDQWPQQNSKEQMEFMLDSSDHLFQMHKDVKNLMTFPLSEEVFKATGQLMLHESWNLTEPILWLNHDVIAKRMAANG
ncbi:MAG: hypothetical protein KDD33_04575 [Bdellovibrionales bacterium]|nr:hypothetical protein [Bdellovibrionales bacterium]